MTALSNRPFHYTSHGNPLARSTTTPRFIDCYDRAVGILTRHPALIYRAWNAGPYMVGLPDTPTPQERRARTLSNYCHCLFSFVHAKPRLICYGCLTQIRQSQGSNFDYLPRDLHKAIREDSRIPTQGGAITVDDLPIFAGWQRRIDIKLNRKPLPIGG